MGPMRGVAFLAEVVEGPGGPATETLAEQLRRALAEFAREHASFVLTEPTLPGRTPECGGVLLHLGAAYLLARTLAETLFPFPVRAAAVWGEVTGSEPGGPDPSEGPAFERAADLLYRARRDGRLLLVQGAHPDVDRLANALVLVLHRQMETWTERQCEVVRLYRRLERQEAVGKELGVSQQSVSSSLNAAGWHALSEAEAALGEILARSPGRGS